jgi:hypothetical protein
MMLAGGWSVRIDLWSGGSQIPPLRSPGRDD